MIAAMRGVHGVSKFLGDVPRSFPEGGSLHASAGFQAQGHSDARVSVRSRLQTSTSSCLALAFGHLAAFCAMLAQLCSCRLLGNRLLEGPVGSLPHALHTTATTIASSAKALRREPYTALAPDSRDVRTGILLQEISQEDLGAELRQLRAQWRHDIAARTS